MSFKNILGNDSIKELLGNSIKSNNILHSYMFIGTDGIGKSIFASEFSKMALCLSENKPCNTCSSCIKFDSNNHPDFMIIDSEDSKSIKIGQIRILQEQIAQKPIISSRKIYVVNNSDLMTIEAQNCLLKTLEEPPDYATIILVLSNENKLLNTIKSRCTKINFQNISDKDLKLFANRNNIEISDTIIKISNGSIGKLLSLKDYADTYSALDNILDSFPNTNIIDIWNSSEILYKSKEDILDFLDYFNIYFFNKLKISNDLKYINSIKIVEDTKKRLSSNANFDMCIDNLLLKIWEEFNEDNNRS